MEEGKGAIQEKKAGALTMENQLHQQLSDISKQLSETNVTITRMYGKIDQLETILNMKVDNNRSELERRIDDLGKEVEALKRKDEKHEDERTQDLKDKQRFTWGIVTSTGIAVMGWVFQLFN